MELMSPVGSYETLQAAIKAGADSIYFGVEQLNMRAWSANKFTVKDIKKITGICSKNKVKSYLTLNTIVYDNEIKLMNEICNEAKKSKVSAVIASDMATIMYANKIKLPIHLSTQCNVTNLDAVKYYSQFAETIVLARELNLDQIKSITSEVKSQKIKDPNKKLVNIEIFIHGALCVAIAGKCYMSLANYNHSANRGACLQSCRRAYRVTDDETGDELKIDNQYVMSPKDLCTISFLDKILDSGVSVLKIEGRGRSPEYVYTVTKTYREAIESYYDGTYTPEKINRWKKDLATVYNRGFWEGGYYLGKKLGDWCGTYGSQATTEKVAVGTVINYFNKANIAYIILDTGPLNVGDNISITGTTTGIVHAKVESIFENKKQIAEAKHKSSITIPLKSKVRKNDRVYKIIKKP